MVTRFSSAQVLCRHPAFLCRHMHNGVKRTMAVLDLKHMTSSKVYAYLRVWTVQVFFCRSEKKRHRFNCKDWLTGWEGVILKALRICGERYWEDWQLRDWLIRNRKKGALSIHVGWLNPGVNYRLVNVRHWVLGHFGVDYVKAPYTVYNWGGSY